MKIAYVYSTMAAAGGTERMITEKANYLAEQYGYDIIIISCFQSPDKENFFNLVPGCQTDCQICASDQKNEFLTVLQLKPYPLSIPDDVMGQAPSPSSLILLDQQEDV